MRRLLTALATLALAGIAGAATPTKHEVLQAISVMEKDLSSPEAVQAAKTIVLYAQDSDDVMVDIGPSQVPWVQENWGLEKARETSCKSILLAAFVAGNVKSQIKNDRAEDDTYSGWIFAIDSYKRLKVKHNFQSPSIEALAKMQTNGTLLQHARDVQAEEQEDGADEPKKPMALLRSASGRALAG
jgi:hypothetical protein